VELLFLVTVLIDRVVKMDNPVQSSTIDQGLIT